MKLTLGTTRSAAAILILVALAPATRLSAWERLVTKSGQEIEGDVTQAEFVLIETTGGEVAIPRAAIERLEATESGIKAFIKDGSTLQGQLQGKFEIEDGLIKRRFEPSDLKVVEFDRFIAVEPRKQYRSCPIRVEINAKPILLDEKIAISSGLSRNVDCNEIRVNTVALKRDGKVAPGSFVSLAATLGISVPQGHDQLIDLMVQIVQGDKVIATTRRRVNADEGKSFTWKEGILRFPGQAIDPSGPAPKFRLQLVSQDSDRPVERGGIFWWFTIPIG